MTPYDCPACKADLRGEEIPEKYKEHYDPCYTHFSKVIGIVRQDSVQAWHCPECKATWKRGEGSETGLRICSIAHG